MCWNGDLYSMLDLDKTSPPSWTTPKMAKKGSGVLKMAVDATPFQTNTITEGHMGISKNSGTPKWMVHNGKPYENGWFEGFTSPIFGGPPIVVGGVRPSRSFTYLVRYLSHPLELESVLQRRYLPQITRMKVRFPNKNIHTYIHIYIYTYIHIIYIHIYIYTYQVNNY